MNIGQTVFSQILDHLNALANDQLYKRIVPMFVGRFQDANIRVGRFTGLTRDDRNRESAAQDVLASDPSLRNIFGNTIPPNWQLTRKEMLAQPPHVLITKLSCQLGRDQSASSGKAI